MMPVCPNCHPTWSVGDDSGSSNHLLYLHVLYLNTLKQVFTYFTDVLAFCCSSFSKTLNPLDPGEGDISSWKNLAEEQAPEHLIVEKFGQGQVTGLYRHGKLLPKVYNMDVYYDLVIHLQFKKSGCITPGLQT